MSSFPLPTAPQRRRRRRRHGPNNTSTSLSSIVTMATATAIAGYGAYRVGSWAWNTWHGVSSQEEEEEQQIQNEAHHHQISPPQSSLQQQLTQKQKRQQKLHRIKRCKIEVLSALHNFLPSLQKAIFTNTDFSRATKFLKKLRLQKRELQLQDDDEEEMSMLEKIKKLEMEEATQWNVVKIKSITRVITTVYAHVLLYLVLNVQVHLLGGRLYRDEYQDKEEEEGETISTTTSSSSSAEAAEFYRESHRIVLTTTFERFLTEGIANLAQHVENVVEGLLEDWHVMTTINENEEEKEVITDINVNDLEDKICHVRDVMEGYTTISSSKFRSREKFSNQKHTSCPHHRRRRRYRGSNFIQYIIPETKEKNDVNNKKEPKNELAEYILNETWDLLESPMYTQAEDDCFNVTFDILKEEGWGVIFEQDEEESDEEEDSAAVVLPLAHVVAQLRHVTKGFYEATTCHTTSYSTASYLNIEGIDDSENMSSSSSPPPPPNNYVLELQRLPSVRDLCDVSFA